MKKVVLIMQFLMTCLLALMPVDSIVGAAKEFIKKSSELKIKFFVMLEKHNYPRRAGQILLGSSPHDVSRMFLHGLAVDGEIDQEYPVRASGEVTINGDVDIIDEGEVVKLKPTVPGSGNTPVIVPKVNKIVFGPLSRVPVTVLANGIVRQDTSKMPIPESGGMIPVFHFRDACAMSRRFSDVSAIDSAATVDPDLPAVLTYDFTVDTDNVFFPTGLEINVECKAQNGMAVIFSYDLEVAELVGNVIVTRSISDTIKVTFTTPGVKTYTLHLFTKLLILQPRVGEYIVNTANAASLVVTLLSNSASEVGIVPKLINSPGILA